MEQEYDLSVVSPAFNEEAVIGRFCERVTRVLAGCGLSYEIILVDDGSRDRTFELMREAHLKDPQRFKALRLARNFGHQLAITAGLRQAKGRAVVVMDCDLQDPPEMITRFIAKWREGFDIVYGVRTERKGETAFKLFTAKLFYKMIRFATKIDIAENAGDFYLLDRKVVDVLGKMEERHRFLRGLVAWVGFRRTGVGYVREVRAAGTTKFGLWKMVKFSVDAATSFSFLPLRFISISGIIISAIAFLGVLISVYLRLFTSVTITGWTSLMVIVLFMGGIQLLALGVMGEYLARIGDDVKQRPLYTVSEVLES